MNKSGKCRENKRITKHSLKAQITAIFVAILASTIIICWLINGLFLEKYYINKRENLLLHVYNEISSQSIHGDLSSDDFDIALQKYSESYNTSIVIISSIFEPVRIYANEPHDRLLVELQSNLIGGKILAERIIEENDDYIMLQRRDSRTQTDYIEMWGSLPDGSFFMLRNALESVKVSAQMANRFLLYTGIGCILAGAVIIYFFTKKISKPILDIADISERVSQMDFEAEYCGKDQNEIAILGNSINKMSNNLKKAISELKEANISLQKDNDLKTRIDEMRKEFVSNVSHELKTPIALIQGYAEGLKEGVNEGEQDYYCDVIIDETSKMNGMVKQLLTLNQLEFGTDILQKEEFDLSLLIRNCVQSVEILTSQNDIQVSVEVPAECNVYADEFKIEEVFINYLSNAINHCESDDVKRIDVKLEKEENNVIVSVYNTGKPIPGDCIEHIWEKFYKVDKARTRQYGGSGVGLSIVKAIMEAHNGSYGVDNNESGVTFWFRL